MSTRWEREPFSLADVNVVDVEALGRRFAEDEGETLNRKAIDATRGEDGKVELELRDEKEAVMAAQPRLPFDSIESDLASRLLQTNGVAATVAEANAATAVARAFLTGAEVTEETPWRAEHGRLATAALVEWISAMQTSKPAREVKDVTQVKWPDPVERVESRPPADRHVITSGTRCRAPVRVVRGFIAALSAWRMSSATCSGAVNRWSTAWTRLARARCADSARCERRWAGGPRATLGSSDGCYGRLQCDPRVMNSTSVVR